MTRRIPGSERTREALRDLIEGRLSSENAKSELVRLATRLIIEKGLEAEVRDALGRDYYERGEGADRGHRNGVRAARLDADEMAAMEARERHLLYVGCTRAREHLLITFADLPSSFLEESEAT